MEIFSICTEAPMSPEEGYSLYSTAASMSNFESNIVQLLQTWAIITCTRVAISTVALPHGCNSPFCAINLIQPQKMMTPIGDKSGFLNSCRTGLPLLISPIRRLHTLSRSLHTMLPRCGSIPSYQKTSHWFMLSV